MWKLLTVLLCATTFLQCAEPKVLVFAGSTRQESLNKQLALEAAAIAKKMGAEVTYIDLRDYPMPFYNGDEEAATGMPQTAKNFRRLLLEHDITVISSPDYNHSFPAILKNALDWASRTEDGKRANNAFSGKKFVLLSASPGKKGGAKGLIHLRDVLVDIKGFVFPQEFSLPLAHEAFAETGELINREQKEALETLLQQAIKTQLAP